LGFLNDIEKWIVDIYVDKPAVRQAASKRIQLLGQLGVE